MKSIYKTGLIYKISFQGSNRHYIGKTMYDISIRITDHIRKSKNKSDLVIHRAIRKYGELNMKISILVNHVPEIFINAFEMYWINHYNTYKDGYNMTIGGDGGITYKWTEEQKTAQSNRMMGGVSPAKGYKWTEEQKLKHTDRIGANNPFWGKTHSDDQKKKWSQARAGVEPWNKGGTHSDETKLKLSKYAKKQASQKYKCIYCGVMVDKLNLARWHNKNCKRNIDDI